MKMSAEGHQLVSNERRGNPLTTGQAAGGSKAPLHIGTEKELSIYTHVTENKIEVKT